MGKIGAKEAAQRAQRERPAQSLGSFAGTGPMTKEEARYEADAIRDAKERLYERVARFYARDGWKALGFSSWAECCRKEFDLTARRGHQLIAHAEVMVALTSAAGLPMGTAVPIPERATRDVAPVLDEVVAEVRADASGFGAAPEEDENPSPGGSPGR